jgi:hypothetical protein
MQAYFVPSSRQTSRSERWSRNWLLPENAIAPLGIATPPLASSEDPGIAAARR